MSLYYEVNHHIGKIVQPMKSMFPYLRLVEVGTLFLMACWRLLTSRLGYSMLVSYPSQHVPKGLRNVASVRLHCPGDGAGSDPTSGNPKCDQCSFRQIDPNQLRSGHQGTSLYSSVASYEHKCNALACLCPPYFASLSSSGVMVISKRILPPSRCPREFEVPSSVRRITPQIPSLCRWWECLQQFIGWPNQSNRWCQRRLVCNSYRIPLMFRPLLVLGQTLGLAVGSRD